MGHSADREGGSNGPNHKGLLDGAGGTLEFCCNPPKRRTIRNLTEGR